MQLVRIIINNQFMPGLSSSLRIVLSTNTFVYNMLG